jgi:hypothetical protein
MKRAGRQVRRLPGLAPADAAIRTALLGYRLTR